MRSSTYWQYYTRAMLKPRLAFEELVVDPRCWQYGIWSVLIPGLGYTLFYFMASNAGGAPSTFKPWLSIPIEKYFFYDIFLALPGYFLSVLTATSTVYLLAKAMKATPSFDSLLAVIGISTGIATWSTMLHDLTDAFLGYVGVIDIRQYERMLNEPTIWRTILMVLFLIYFTWFQILFTKGIRAATKLSNAKAAILGFVCLAVFQGVLLIFIR